MQTTSEFLRNEACPQCRKLNRDRNGDNLGVYSDGHCICWSCGYYVPPDALKQVAQKLGEAPQASETKVVVLPHDVDVNYPSEALEWIAKYELTRSDLLINRVLWSESRRLLIFSFSDGEGRIIAWQGRNFGTVYRTKWFGRGQLEDTFVFFPRNKQRITRIFFVEDVVSALKLGKYFDSKKELDGWVAMPIFGSHISQLRLSRCLLLFHDNPTVTIWLDRDKASQAIKFAKQAESLGFTSSTIITEVDPKEIKFANLLSVFNKY